MAFPYIFASADGGLRQYFNYTFWIGEHTSAFGWGLAPTPRSHGDRGQDRAYLNGKPITIRGFVGAGYSPTGSMPFNWTLTPQVNSTVRAIFDATATIVPLVSVAGFANSGRTIIGGEVIYYNGRDTALNNLLQCWRGMEGTAIPPFHTVGEVATAPAVEAQYFDQLRNIFTFLHENQRGILDYRNGWVQYVLFESIKDVQVEGWPDTRAVEIVFKVEDPLAYSLQQAVGIVDPAVTSHLTAMINGQTLSRHYRLKLRATRPVGDQTIKIDNGYEPAMSLVVPDATQQPLVLSGFTRGLFLDTLPIETAWARYIAGSTMPYLRPGPNTWAFTNVGVPSATVTLGPFLEDTVAANPLLITGNVLLSNAADFPTSGTITIGTEIITYTGKTGNNLTGCTRGTGGSTAASHPLGTLVISANKLFQVDLVAHGADWLADSFRVPQNLPPGEYDYSLYDLAVYGSP